MKKLIAVLLFSGLVLFAGCKKDETSSRYKLLTGPVWTTESLLANGTDASGPGQLLENFKGDAKFNGDGTGYFGQYEGTWYFAFQETQIVIQTSSLPVPLTTVIEELTESKLKISTSIANTAIPGTTISIVMTFIPK